MIKNQIRIFKMIKVKIVENRQSETEGNQLSMALKTKSLKDMLHTVKPWSQSIHIIIIAKPMKGSSNNMIN